VAFLETIYLVLEVLTLAVSSQRFNANEALASHNLRLPCQASLACATTSDEIFFEVTCGV